MKSQVLSGSNFGPVAASPLKVAAQSTSFPVEGVSWGPGLFLAIEVTVILGSV